MIWILRYKKPQGLGLVQIETIGETEADAKAYGQELVNKMPGPAYRFISVEPWLFASQKKDQAAQTPVKPAEGPVTQGQPMPAGVKVAKAKAGRLGQ